eukprot:scaffold47601_cov34-Prasinocladus_malaysianus.AAC.1
MFWHLISYQCQALNANPIHFLIAALRLWVGLIDLVARFVVLSPGRCQSRPQTAPTLRGWSRQACSCLVWT